LLVQQCLEAGDLGEGGLFGLALGLLGLALGLLGLERGLFRLALKLRRLERRLLGGAPLFEFVGDG
jgi:hypothetical protein